MGAVVSFSFKVTKWCLNLGFHTKLMLSSSRFESKTINSEQVEMTFANILFKPKITLVYLERLFVINYQQTWFFSLKIYANVTNFMT